MRDPLPFLASVNEAGTPVPIAMAHRGFSLEGLENSMTAFRAAADLGYRYLETDVHTTADGVLFLFHDAQLDRITDRKGRISRLSAAEVGAAKIGGVEAIPLFDELVTEFPDIRLNLDVKDWNSVRSLAAAVERHGVHDRVLVTSFSDLRRRAVTRLLSREVAASAGTITSAVFVLLGPFLPSRLLTWVMRGIHALQVPVSYGRVPVVTPALIRRAHRHGLQVHVWTINEAAEMNRLLDLGVDGIVSDRADLLKQVLQAREAWHRPPPG